MHSFSQSDLDHLAALCKIALKEGEGEKFKGKLSNILNYIEQLNELNTDSVQSFRHTVGEQNALSVRDDSHIEKLPRELFLENCPSHVGGMVRIFPVIKF